MTATTPSLVLDVFPAGPAELRRKLQDRAMAACLPGGLRMEESLAGVSYELEAPGGWTLTQLAGEFHISHLDGHVVVVGPHGVTLRPAQ